MRLQILCLCSSLLAIAGCRVSEIETAETGNVGAAVAPAPAPATAQDMAAAPAQPPSGAIVSGDGQNFSFAAQGDLQITGNDHQYEINLPTDVLFDFDRAELRAEAEPLLQQVKTHFASNRTSQVHVRGHTDSKGENQYNFRLSMRRASAVCDWLRREAQISGLTNCIGRGEEEPLAANENPDGSDKPVGRQRNRRVTLRVVRNPDTNAMLEEARRRSQDARQGIERR